MEQATPSPPPTVAGADVADGDSVLKKKRGRPARGVPKTTTTAASAPPQRRQKREDEDVCFICFDGGSLVLCDRRGCPKAYHPSCVKRDEAFFRSKAKWNCGWHLCTKCAKTSHYMCYTCPYSLCKRCTKGADFVCVRENKGLCGICMKTIMLIEKSAQGNEKCDVDFDDKSSWEYLFKVYWMYLKEKLSLTCDELLRAENPWKGAASMKFKVQTPHELYHPKVEQGSGSEISSIDIEPNDLKNKMSNTSDEHHILDGVLNDVGCCTQDLPMTCEPTGNTCTIKNQVNTNEAAIDDNTSGVVRLEASSVPVGISSSLLSTGIEQPTSDFLNALSWHYQDPSGQVQGPFSILQLRKWNESRFFPPDLRIWRTDQKQDNSILLNDALSGKSSLNVSLSYNSQQQSLESCVTLDNKGKSQDGVNNATRNDICASSQIVEQSLEQKVDCTCTQSLESCVTLDSKENSQDGVKNATRNDICASSQIVEQSLEQKVDGTCTQSLESCVTLDSKENSQDGVNNVTRNDICINSQIVEQSLEQKVDGSCTQSNGKDESIRIDERQSPSPCTVPVDANNNESQSGNIEKMELSKCEISCHNGPHVYPTLPSTAFLDNLNENPRVFSDKLNENPSSKLSEGQGNEGNSEDNGNYGSNRISEGQSPSGQSYQKQSDSEENSGQSTSQNWSGPPIIIPTPVNPNSWMAALFGETTDFSSLVDESVSDLLAEVEAMESLGGGLESPTSIMKCGEELTDGSITECLSFANGFGAMLDAGKGDALGSTADLNIPYHSNAAEEPFQQAGVHQYPHHQKMPGEHPSRSSEVESTFSTISWNPTNQFSWGPNC